MSGRLTPVAVTPEQYIDAVADRLAADGFKVSSVDLDVGRAVVAYRGKISVRRMGWLRLFVVLLPVEEATADLLHAFDQQACGYANLRIRRTFSVLMVIPALVAASADEGARRLAEKPAKRRSSWMTMPAVVDLTAARIFYYAGSRWWGLLYLGWHRAHLRRALPLPVEAMADRPPTQQSIWSSADGVAAGTQPSRPLHRWWPPLAVPVIWATAECAFLLSKGPYPSRPSVADTVISLLILNLLIGWATFRSGVHYSAERAWKLRDSDQPTTGGTDRWWWPLAIPATWFAYRLVVVLPQGPHQVNQHPIRTCISFVVAVALLAVPAFVAGYLYRHRSIASAGRPNEY